MSQKEFALRCGVPVYDADGEILASPVAMTSQPPGASPKVEITSEFVVFPSRSGVRLAAFWDHGLEDYERFPFVIMAPKYGETKKNNLQLAYSIAANGVNVLRFDHAAHVGESDGPRTGFTLPSGVDDILGAVDYVHERFGAGTVSLVASSLSARTAIRAAAQDARIAHLVCIVGVVNVQATLREVYRDDLVAEYLAGKRWGVTDILGHEIDFDRFLGAAIESRMHDLQGTGDDLGRIAAPVLFCNGDEDAWVEFAEVEAVVGRAPRGTVRVLSGAKHEVRENDLAAEEVFRVVVGEIVRRAWGMQELPRVLRRPEKRRLLAQNRVERERLRMAAPREKTELDFWSDYLRKFELIDRVDEYRRYLDLIGELLGPIDPDEVILDAGCGNGLFGAWLLRNLESDPEATVRPVYVGLDLSESGLREAAARHGSMLVDRESAAATGSGRMLDLCYARADFDGLEVKGTPALPAFATGTFDAVCCSLVVSYLADPRSLLREFRRLLRPGGRIVVSSMKPYCDMSSIYRDFMEQTTSVVELESARNLLRAAGTIKLKEEQGYYSFFSGAELSKMLVEAGFAAPRAFSSFGGQAVVVGSKA